MAATSPAPGSPRARFANDEVIQQHRRPANAGNGPASGGSDTQQSNITSSASSSSLSIVFNASWVRLTAPIGEGAFSRVYEGVYRNPETLEESVVAVKILKKNMLKRRSDCLRFIKEAKIMTKISHRNIAACYGIGKYEDDDPHNPGSLFIVQELIRGGNLLHKVYKQMLNRGKCVYTSQEALVWMMNVASGMQYLHKVTETKPMIIHRDLKLENIMLAYEPGGISAKLVDFGLHKVIDDRIKKVVKRVISEANLGMRLNRLRGQMADEEETFNMDDELEAALAEQQAMVVASSVKRGVGPAAASPLGAPSPLRQGPPTRMTSRMLVDSPGGQSMSSMPEDVDEEELAIQQQQEETRRREELVRQQQQQQQQQQQAGVYISTPPAQGVLPAQVSAPTQLVDSSSMQASGLNAAPSEPASRSPLSQAVTATSSDESAASSNPSVARIRAPVKKQSSMQRLMAKMKEIRLKVTGNAKDSPAAAATPTAVQVQPSMLSRSSQVNLVQTAVGGVSSAAPLSADEITHSPNHSQLANVETAPASAMPRGDAASMVINGGERAIATAISEPQPLPTQVVQQSSQAVAKPQDAHREAAVRGVAFDQTSVIQQQPIPAAALTAEQLEDKRLRNVQLLDRIVKEQSVAADNGRNQIMDDLNLFDAQRKMATRAPPRRAVTMITEIRYNLTEAVGSWAYMAPEVVLGQPYNEKVDVFSFGVILFEVLNRKLMLVDEIKNDPRKDAQAYAERVARGFRPEIPKAWPEQLHDLISACWAQDPHCRPNFSAVVDALQEIHDEGLIAKLDVQFWSRGDAFI